jgi:hypothetical protein
MTWLGPMRLSCWVWLPIRTARPDCPAPASPGRFVELAATTWTSKTERIQAVLRTEQLSQPPQLVADYAAMVRATAAVITTFNAEIAALQRQGEAHFCWSTVPGPLLGRSFARDPAQHDRHVPVWD